MTHNSTVLEAHPRK